MHESADLLSLDTRTSCFFDHPPDTIARAERDGTRAETRFRLSPKRTSSFISVGASVQSTAGNRVVRISFSNAGYTTFGGGVRVLATHSIRQFPLHFPSRASPCATRFRTSSTTLIHGYCCVQFVPCCSRRRLNPTRSCDGSESYKMSQGH